MTASGGLARLLRVYGWWIVLVTAATMVAGFALGHALPVEYKASAIVVVEARVRPNTTPVQPDMGTEKELAQSGLVIEPAAKALGEDPSRLLNGLAIAVAPDANVLTFAYTDADPAVAQRLAQALAEAYVAYRNGGEAQETASDTTKRTAAATSSQHATLVTPAALPSVPVERPVWIDMGIGGMLGLLLGAGTALLWDRLSDRIRGRADFERVAGAPVLATVPRERRRRGVDRTLPITVRAPGSAQAESYRYLRSRLHPLLRDGATTVLVTSASEREGRTTTAANLATTLALAGRTIILVDADLRHPTLHDVFGVGNERGLTDLLAGSASTTEVLQDTPVPRLRLVTSGPPHSGGVDLLDGSRLTRTLRSVQQHCDIVVLDCAPLLTVSDGITLAGLSDHLLLVGYYGRTTRGRVARAMAELRDVVDANVSGVLLNVRQSGGGLHVWRRRPAAAAPVEPVDATTLLSIEAKPRQDAAGRAALPPGASLNPKPAAPASTVYSSAAAVALNQTVDSVQLPRPRGDGDRPLERHN
jgi:capsular exopolysaccharide synthesis family protein